MSLIATQTISKDTFIMKRFVAIPLLLSLFSMGLIGCAEKDATKRETTITTPGGKTTTTQEVEVRKTGKNPPAETP